MLYSSHVDIVHIYALASYKCLVTPDRSLYVISNLYHNKLCAFKTLFYMNMCIYTIYQNQKYGAFK